MKEISKELKQALIDGEVFITTKTFVREAVRESIKHMEHGSGFYEISENLTDDEINDICDEVVDYLIE